MVRPSCRSGNVGDEGLQGRVLLLSHGAGSGELQEAFETKTAEQRNFGASDVFVLSQ